MTSRDKLGWLSHLDARISDLGTLTSRPFPPAPIPTQPGRVISDQGGCGTERNGLKSVPDDQERANGLGTANPLQSLRVPDVPGVPAPEKSPCEDHDREVGMGRTFPVPTSDLRAHVNHQNERVLREHRVLSKEVHNYQSLEDGLPVPDPTKKYLMIGYCAFERDEWLEERAAILEYDAGLPRAEAEAQAHAEMSSADLADRGEHSELCRFLDLRYKTTE